MSFLNVVEIESALVGLATQYPDQAHLIPLPFKTFEGRQCNALTIGSGPRCPQAGLLIISGVHSRERGGPDICVYFAADLLEAYRAGTGLVYGATVLGGNGIWFTSDQIQSIVERLDVIVFPCVNPDGYNYAQTTNSNWRKNRNPASSGGQAGRIGVDVNRNFDILWNLSEFHPAAQTQTSLGSPDPANDLFHGTAPFSEPETGNVRWLFDRFPQISHFIDIHSYGGDILHPWGDDDNQSTNPGQNFTNAAWHGNRGFPGDGYGEYIPPGDVNRLVSLAGAMRDAIAAVRSQTYSISQSFRLPNWPQVTYPTSGSSEDWAFSRHFADPAKRKVDAFTLEFNRTPTFLVTWAEMQPIIAEIDAGLIKFCLRAVPSFSLPLWVCNGLRWWLTIWHKVFPPDLWGPYGPWLWIRRPLEALFRFLTLPFGRG